MHDCCCHGQHHHFMVIDSTSHCYYLRCLRTFYSFSQLCINQKNALSRKGRFYRRLFIFGGRKHWRSLGTFDLWCSSSPSFFLSLISLMPFLSSRLLISLLEYIGLSTKFLGNLSAAFLSDQSHYPKNVNEND